MEDQHRPFCLIRQNGQVNNPVLFLLGALLLMWVVLRVLGSIPYQVRDIIVSNPVCKSLPEGMGCSLGPAKVSRSLLDPGWLKVKMANGRMLRLRDDDVILILSQKGGAHERDSEE